MPSVHAIYHLLQLSVLGVEAVFIVVHFWSKVVVSGSRPAFVRAGCAVSNRKPIVMYDLIKIAGAREQVSARVGVPSRYADSCKNTGGRTR